MIAASLRPSTWALSDTVAAPRFSDPPSPEAVALRESRRHHPSGLGAGAEPGVELGLGAHAVLALAPAQPVGEAEDLGVGEAAVLVALQHDAAAAAHLGHL